MTITYTTEQNLEKLDNTSNPDEAFNDNMTSLDAGRTFKITAGAALSAYDAIYISQADDKAELADANASGLEQIIGLVKDTTIAEDADGFAYGAGSLVTNEAWDWDMSKPIFLSDTAGELTQTASTTAPVIVGFPTAPTKMILTPIYLNFQLATIADPVACAATTATTPGTGADATTWTGAQCTAAYNDLVALKSAVDANNAAIDSILARLEALGISATA